jgi:hypothetical protein
MRVCRYPVGFHECYLNLPGRMAANDMKSKVDTVLNVWQAWSLFPA